MWIKYSILLSCLVTTLLAADEHRPKRTSKDERGKRQLEYSIAHHYSGPHSFRADRRISTGSQLQYHHNNPPYFPTGSRPYHLHKGRPHSLPPPPYAVQMEPLFQYSQKDPLYDTNIFSLHTDGLNDLSTDTNHISEHIYGPPAHKIIERPVYIKEPEPIIEIIIKESNVSLPAPPTTAAPKKKKEEVQVFYVKYKKNPGAHGKDSIIYDKPVAAITPKVPHDEIEEEHHPNHNYHVETATLPPPPSTTLRTIIKPDSETYHSPSGIKVTFGKEGFDYSKRQVGKPDDLPQQHPQSSEVTHSVQFPQGRQLSSFSTYTKRAPGPGANYNFQSPVNNFRPDQRPPQSYRPFNAPPSTQYKQPSSSFGRPPPPPQSTQYSQNNYPFQSPPYVKPTQSFNGPSYNRPSYPSNPSPYSQFPSGPANPPPPTFQTPRQPVPYKPFEKIRPNFTPSESNYQHIQQTFGSSQSSFSHQQSPSQPAHQSHHHHHQQQGPFSQNSQQLPAQEQKLQFRPDQQHYPTQQQLPLTQQSSVFNQPPAYPQHNEQVQHQSVQNQVHVQHNQHQYQHQQPQQQQHQPQFQNQQHQYHQQQQQQQYPNPNPQQQLSQQQLPSPQPQQQFQQSNQNEHLLNLQHAQNSIPPGGELIQALPKFETHFSVVEPGNSQQPQSLALQSQANLLEQQRTQQTLQQQRPSVQPVFGQKIQPQYKHTVQNVNVENRGNPQINPLQNVQQYSQNSGEINSQDILQQYFQQSNIHAQPSPSYQQQQNAYSTQRPTTRITSTTQRVYQSTTTPTTTTTEAATPSTTTKDPKILEAQLPDEVPEDLRAQLLSSGILNNADISILDYDKVGDIPLSALPPDQLANFYQAGGGAQLGAGSEPVPQVVSPSGQAQPDLDLASEGSEVTEVKTKPVEMKVVHYNPETDQGQRVQDTYVKESAQQVDPVVLHDNTYNRYLPLKVNGTQFPIPDVPELQGKKISSVVILAPVAYDFSAQRKTRNAEPDNELDLIQGQALKNLLDNPTKENYRKFLEDEKRISSDKQSVILLVTGSSDPNKKDKEIFMYEVATKTVSKLSGELSSAFVDAAEANADKEEDEREAGRAAASNIIETRVPYHGEIDRKDTLDELDLDGAGSEIANSNIPIIDPMQGDLDTEASEQLDSFVDFSGRALNSEDMIVSESRVQPKEQKVLIESGYSKTGRS